MDAEKAAPKQAREVVDMLRELFMLERQVPWVSTEAWEEYEAALRSRAHVRETKSKPLVDALVQWCEAQTALLQPV